MLSVVSCLDANLFHRLGDNNLVVFFSNRGLDDRDAISIIVLLGLSKTKERVRAFCPWRDENGKGVLIIRTAAC